MALTIDPSWLHPEERKVATAGGDFLKPPNNKSGSKKGGTTPGGSQGMTQSSSGHNLLPPPERRGAESSTQVNTTSNSPLPVKPNNKQDKFSFGDVASASTQATTTMSPDDGKEEALLIENANSFFLRGIILLEHNLSKHRGHWRTYKLLL